MILVPVKVELFYMVALLTYTLCEESRVYLGLKQRHLRGENRQQQPAVEAPQ